MAGSWWRDPTVDDGEEDATSDHAVRLWKSACGTLMAPAPEEAWVQIEEHSAPNTLWHSLKNCVAHQAGVWQNLLAKGMDDVIQPAAFKLALVLRHTPTEVTTTLLNELLRLHPQAQDLTSYILTLLTDDEAGCKNCLPRGENSPISPAPQRDLQLFGDCELAVLAAPMDQYDNHSKLVRAEYSKLSQEHYIELRIKVLNQFSQIPKVFHTPEFQHFEKAARENIEREIRNLREELLTNHGKNI
ncbi:hypothetical protein JYU34_020728 [Plutella xylostella]|uniref:Uncharacterized protein n=2 Tax=Plutella xylostella TaxID=51655 RepID=A0ABQ7PUX6_PLUXY|nr:uncharacterized protein LOC105398757 [Plutella xylostella]KAG7296788.1 hypothetical protein JYU34_020728 [Plutella xylostella]CAG9132516.1 unnamed protein product [Plutella xylostella]